MQRLKAAGLLPERAGQPIRGWVRMTLAELLALDGDGAFARAVRVTAARARWAGAPRGCVGGPQGDGAAWLDGACSRRGLACDALMSPDSHGRRGPRRPG